MCSWWRPDYNTASVGAAFHRLGVPVTLERTRPGVRTVCRAARCGKLCGWSGFAEAGRARAGCARTGALWRTHPRHLSGHAAAMRGSKEAPGVAGLGLIEGTLQRFGTGVRVPQLGWNTVEAGPGARLLASGAGYYANSYRLDRPQRAGVQPGAPTVNPSWLPERGRVLARRCIRSRPAPGGSPCCAAGWTTRPPFPARRPAALSRRARRRVVKGVRFQGSETLATR